MSNTRQKIPPMAFKADFNKNHPKRVRYSFVLNAILVIPKG